MEKRLKQEKVNKFNTILFFGPPGSGKGTQGKFLSSAGNHYHLSSGDIFRGLSPESDSGMLVHKYANSGTLVPDEVTIEIWHRYVMGLIATNKYFPKEQLLLLDGLPRTLRQAEILEEFIHIKKIIFLDVIEDNIVSRLQRRALIENRHDDKDANILSKRMKIYQNETIPILNRFPTKLLCKIDASQRPLEVLRDILVSCSDVLS